MLQYSVQTRTFLVICNVLDKKIKIEIDENIWCHESVGIIRF